MIARSLPPSDAIAPVRRAYSVIHALARLLEPDDEAGEGGEGGSSAMVQSKVLGWATALGHQLRRTPREREWREHFRAMVANFGRRLYTCYDYPSLPRTNNDLEQGLRALSRAERRITGRKHVGRRLVRTPGLIGAGARLATAPAPVQLLATLPLADRRGFSTRRRKRARPRGAACAFRRDPAAYLARVEVEK